MSYVYRDPSAFGDLALYVGRVRCGLTLKELDGYVGMNIRAVSQAAMRIEAWLKREKELGTAYRKTIKILGEANGQLKNKDEGMHKIN